mgnify:CR=1 FL=1
MFLTDVFYSKVVDDQGEGDRAVDVLPQPRCVGHLVVAFGGEALLEELVG